MADVDPEVDPDGPVGKRRGVVCWDVEFEFAIAVREAFVMAREVVRSEFAKGHLSAWDGLASVGVDDGVGAGDFGGEGSGGASGTGSVFGKEVGGCREQECECGGEQVERKTKKTIWPESANVGCH